MLAAEDWARAQGAERMVLDLDANNTGALRLYERLGYEVDGARDGQGDRAGRRGDRRAGRRPQPRTARSCRRSGASRSSLRPIRPDDREALIEVLSDPSVVAVWDTRGPENSTDELLAGDEDWTVWAIEVDGEFAGSIQAAERTTTMTTSHAGIDIFMHSRFQGRGLGHGRRAHARALPHRGARPPPADDRPRRGQCPGDPHLREGRLQAGRRDAPVRARRATARTTTAC